MCDCGGFASKIFHLILPNLQVGVKYHLEFGTILMVFPGLRLNSIHAVRFERPSSQDLDPFSTGHTSGPGKPLKWFGIPMTLNPQPKGWGE